MNAVQFASSQRDQLLFAQLRRQVDEITKHADPRVLVWIRIKAIGIIALYFGLYGLSLAFIQSTLIYTLCYVLMGITLVPIFLIVVHEAVHDNLFQNKALNNYILYTFDLLGANSFIWKRRHKMLHHSFQNIAGWDTDIEQCSIMRVYPHDVKKNFHRYQHRFMWVLYPFYLLNWVFIRDFKDFFSKRQIVWKVCHIPRREYFKLIFFKSVFLCYTVVLPTLFGQHIVIAMSSMLLMILTGSIFALLILLTPHANLCNEFPRPDESGKMNISWLQHQFATTNDVQVDNWFSRNVLANFNFHLAHHLFPGISHIHAREITELIVDFCKSNGFQYRSHSLVTALKYHYELIKQNAIMDNIFEEDM